MHAAANDIPPPQGLVAPPEWPIHPEIEPRESRNLLLLAAHQVIFRVGWIFKTETVIMPAFLDWLAGPGAGWLRGCLPVLNRLGQSVPPVLFSGTLTGMPYKRRALAACVVLMSLPFAVLSVVCLTGDAQRLVWMRWVFLALYGVFFIFNGLYQLSFGTVQGKLIRPTRRGRLLVVSTFWGSIPAMVFAWWLLPRWLRLPDGGFGYIFAFCSAWFVLSGLVVLLLFEPADHASQQAARPLGSLADTWDALRRDANLRRLVMVAMLFGAGLIIFPHYQTLGLGPLRLGRGQLMVFVIVQNASVGVFSLFAGPLADALGNRLTLRTLIFGSAVAPLIAVLLSSYGTLGAPLFWIVFIPLGVMPLVFRILVNYALEICEPVHHPRYLSTVSLSLAVPLLFSPLVGWLVDLVGFPVVFLSTAGLVLLGGYMTFHLDEPRYRVPDGRFGAFGPGGEE